VTLTSAPGADAGQSDGRRLPLIVPFVVGITCLPLLLPVGTIAGFRYSGWAWVLPCLLGALIVVVRAQRVALPVLIWAPWIAVVVVNLLLRRHGGALQYSVQLLCPLAVGAAASSFRYSARDVQACYVWFRRLAVALFVIVLMRYPGVLLLRLPSHADLAAPSMTATLLTTVLLLSALYGRRQDYWFALLAMSVPIIGINRTAIAATLILPVATLGPQRLRTRVVTLLLAIVMAIALFSTDRVQRIMFRSDSGSLSELSWDNPDLDTSGRGAMWRVVRPSIATRPWLGHGPRSCAAVLLRSGFMLDQPHNDWLRLTHDFGLIGTVLFTAAMLGQCGLLFLGRRRARGPARLLCEAGIGAAIPLFALMVTDNIVTYASYFCNLHFLIIGLACGALAYEQEETSD
jgi:O-antigen ligase